MVSGELTYDMNNGELEGSRYLEFYPSYKALIVTLTATAIGSLALWGHVTRSLFSLP